jgi:hypothetical protein
MRPDQQERVRRGEVPVVVRPCSDTERRDRIERRLVVHANFLIAQSEHLLHNPGGDSVVGQYRDYLSEKCTLTIVSDRIDWIALARRTEESL